MNMASASVTARQHKAVKSFFDTETILKINTSFEFLLHEHS